MLVVEHCVYSNGWLRPGNQHKGIATTSRLPIAELFYVVS